MSMADEECSDAAGSGTSLQRDLSIGLAVALVVVMACQWLLVTLVMRQVVRDYVVSRLEHDAENLLANLDLTLMPGLALNPERIDPIYTQPWSGHYYQIHVREETLRSRSLWDAELTVDMPGQDKSLMTESRPWARSLWSITRAYYKQGHAVLVVVAEEMSHVERGVWVLQLGHGAISLLAIAVLLMLQRRALRRAVAPLNQAGVALREIEQGATPSLPVQGLFVEILPFVIAINRLLALLHARLERSRQAAGNMAHAIKTPLTVLMRLIEGEELRDHVELRARIVRQIELIRALTSRELKKVRLSGVRSPVGRLEMIGELRVLVDVMRRAHGGRNLRIETRMPDSLSAIIDREDLLELVGNLLDNACKWAVGRVRLSVTDADGWTLRVEDDGPGCAPEQFERILRRGGRAEDAEGVAGQGIGLSVVQEIVLDYGGRIALGRSEALGGFCVEVVLPLKAVA
ncbi:Adaptive-response sensory-kinase SasA [Candidatus Magnetaquicoccaceae bacterium FCR-1]|uniref:histidine kinase n=1 Tax=Candidatus Magnetaquiglobus chichijimensis TaxID=3141448 RepID=A0ABQ0C7F2_9PROT